ncbi:MAG: hypothetical protein ABI183_21190 [Polyangiaceae bacterium]
MSGRQHTNASRPVGTSAVFKFVKAAIGSTKNITPKREKRRSFVRWNAWSAASASSNFTFAVFRARSFARASIGAETSIPRTVPAAPTFSESAIVVAPDPHPMSTTRSPDLMAAFAIAAFPKGASD